MENGPAISKYNNNNNNNNANINACMYQLIFLTKYQGNHFQTLFVFFFSMFNFFFKYQNVRII